VEATLFLRAAAVDYSDDSSDLSDDYTAVEE
jgi:hypothetical protein